MSKFFAHTKEGSHEKQLLCDHLEEVAKLAKDFKLNDTTQAVFEAAGFLHDFGKYQLEFQHYLLQGGRKGSVPHAEWGAAYARNIMGSPEIALVVSGHHKGLPDRAELKSLDAYKTDDEVRDRFEKVADAFRNDIARRSIPLPKLPYKALEQELFIRCLFSAVVDADRLNTEKFCTEEKAAMRSAPPLYCEALIAQLEKHFSGMSKEGNLNLLRNEVRDYAVSLAKAAPGFYSMNLPTGMGKTLASIAWALHHAQHNNLTRIIIVLPYINIIDQTASILKGILGEENILEHHSGYNDSALTHAHEAQSDEDHDANAAMLSKQLATENWDYPIIVTTSVQFFESLFSNHPSKCRKFHNIANAVVIFDEIQTLEKKLVLPTLTMLKNMNSLMRTSFLFCTATQPAFEKKSGFNGLETIVPLVKNPAELFAATRRVSYFPLHGYRELETQKLLEAVKNEQCAALIVCNTKKAALDIFKAAATSVTWNTVYHLSTAMCPAHRKAIIGAIRADLKKEDKPKILVVSTQLIEAGVDFDFPCVFREYAPLESIIQAAGRCNREDRLPQFGKVFIFKLKDAGVPSIQYKNIALQTLDMIEGDNISKLHRHDFFTEYYKNILELFFEDDKGRINELRGKFDFPAVKTEYKLIDTKTRGLFIGSYDDESKRLLDTIRERIRITLPLRRSEYRAAQLYSVQVYQNFLDKNKDRIEQIGDDILLWNGKYNAKTGITDEAFAIEDFMG